MRSTLRMKRPSLRCAAGFGSLIALTACSDSLDTFPLNDAAKKIGEPKIVFIRQGIDQGPVTATMPDGEVLTGTYRVARNGAMGTMFGTGGSATALAIGSGTSQFVLRGPKTEMLCNVNVSVGGHGNGQCQTTDAAVWTVSF